MSRELDAARRFAARVVYMPDHALDTLVLAAATTHCPESFQTVCRLLFRSQNGGTGKTVSMDTFGMLAQNPWKVNATGPALRAKFKEPDGVTPMFDEISSIFGRHGRNGGNSDLARVIREGYRDDATLSHSVGGVAEEYSCYAVVAMGGLGTPAAPDVLQRCIVFHMVAKPAGMTLLSSLMPGTRERAVLVRSALHGWARTNMDDIGAAYRRLWGIPVHPALDSRLREIWGSLFAVASVAGGEWPSRCLASFEAMALDAAQVVALLPEEMVTRDAAAMLTASKADAFHASELLAYVQSLDEGLYRRSTPRELFDLFSDAFGRSNENTIVNGKRARGWQATPVHVAWMLLEDSRTLPDYQDDAEDDPFAFFDD